VHRNADGARLVGDRAGDRLPDPPGRIGRELVAAAVFEFVDRLHQADIAFLDQIEELQAAIGVFLGDRDDEAQVGLDHFLLGDRRLALALLHLVDDAAELGDGNAGLGARDSGSRRAGRGSCPSRSWKIPSSPCPKDWRSTSSSSDRAPTLIFLQELVAAHAIAFGQAQQLALVLNQTLVDVVELLDQRLDAGLVERQRSSPR
jgi:hypothetical protein